MTPDEEIDLLDAELNRLLDQHPGVNATLRITNTALRACTQTRWESHGWHPTDDELHKIMNGKDADRRTALLSLLRAHYISKVEFVPGVDIIQVIPNQSA